MQEQEDNQSGIDVDEEESQYRIERISPGHPRDHKDQAGLIAKHVRKPATSRILTDQACLYAIQSIADNRGDEQPEGNRVIERGEQEKANAEEDRRVREDIGTYPQAYEQLCNREEQALA
ncbi:MAG: hypothetical protein J2P37_35455 [Ktedonobacteraceae bacterium]|nr:hypothetical protein [Ktedonobacteraceae bacterium]